MVEDIPADLGGMARSGREQSITKHKEQRKPVPGKHTCSRLCCLPRNFQKHIPKGEMECCSYLAGRQACTNSSEAGLSITTRYKKGNPARSERGFGEDFLEQMVMELRPDGEPEVSCVRKK